MTKTITFNTGRKYTAEGQKITATLHADNQVTFWDSSREITGEFECFLPDFFCRDDVMHAYDGNHYNDSSRAWADSKHGGCNS